jgi:uncharacterized protein CbrC (UPF0167 family)
MNYILFYKLKLDNMKKLCFLHKWSKWELIETLDEVGKPDKLHKKCIKCGKVKEYIGFTNVDITAGDKTPYIYTD